jgi:hypothetical protein
MGNFVKFGGGTTIHHNRSMLEEFLSIFITSRLIKGASLMFLEVDQDPPLRIIDDVVWDVMLWPSKLTRWNYCHGWGLCVNYYYYYFSINFVTF